MANSWPSEDTKWAGARKSKWSSVRKDLAWTEHLSAKDIRQLQAYFLEGRIDDEFEFRSPTFVRFMMESLQGVTKAECDEYLETYGEAQRSDRFAQALKRIAQTVDDPRRESAQKFFEMLRAGTFPQVFGNWLRTRGVEY